MIQFSKIKELINRLASNNNLNQDKVIQLHDYEEKLNEDNVKNIRIDNRAKTTLGKMLDSQYIAPFFHPNLGRFNTTEGFWYYISSPEPNELFRELHGHECRKLIHDIRKESISNNRVYVPFFKEHIYNANYLKITQNPHLRKLLMRSKLPFEYYYVDEKRDPPVLVQPTSRRWVLQQFEDIRDKLKRKEYSSKNSDVLPITLTYDEIICRISKDGRKVNNLTL
jgi:hypothetical protein